MGRGSEIHEDAGTTVSSSEFLKATSTVTVLTGGESLVRLQRVAYPSET